MTIQVLIFVSLLASPVPAGGFLTAMKIGKRCILGNIMLSCLHF